MQAPFDDIGGLPTDAQEAIEWCRQNGISVGTSDRTFDPYSPVTRWQMALFLHRFAVAFMSDPTPPDSRPGRGGPMNREGLPCLNCEQPLVRPEDWLYDIVHCTCGMQYTKQLLCEANPVLWHIALDPTDRRIRLERAVLDGRPRVIVYADYLEDWSFLDNAAILIEGGTVGEHPDLPEPAA
jgi:hypothetical protein